MESGSLTSSGWACPFCGGWISMGVSHQCPSQMPQFASAWTPPVSVDALILAELQAIKALLQKLVDVR